MEAKDDLAERVQRVFESWGERWRSFNRREDRKITLRLRHDALVLAARTALVTEDWIALAEAANSLRVVDAELCGLTIF